MNRVTGLGKIDELREQQRQEADQDQREIATLKLKIAAAEPNPATHAISTALKAGESVCHTFC